MLFDTHCHLDDPRLVGELDAVLERAKEAGVRRMTTIGCANDVESVRSAVDIARRYPGRISATVGVHPHDAKHLDDALCDAIRDAGTDPCVVAIGDSITDGQGSSSNLQRRWPDYLARRLQAELGAAGRIGVVNLDSRHTIPRTTLRRRVTAQPAQRMAQACRVLHAASGC